MKDASLVLSDEQLTTGLLFYDSAYCVRNFDHLKWISMGYNYKMGIQFKVLHVDVFNLSWNLPRRPLKLLYCWPIWFSGSDVSVMWWAKLELWIKWLTSLLDWRDLLRRLLRGLLRGLFSSTSILRDMSSTRLRLRASLSPPLRKSISESTWKSEKTPWCKYVCLGHISEPLINKVLPF